MASKENVKAAYQKDADETARSQRGTNPVLEAIAKAARESKAISDDPKIAEKLRKAGYYADLPRSFYKAAALALEFIDELDEKAKG